MAIRETCVLCNQPPYVDHRGRKWDMCITHCQQVWGSDRPPEHGTRRKLKRRNAAALTATDFDSLPPAPPDPGDFAAPVRMVLFDLNSNTAVVCECTPISGRTALAHDTPALKEQIRKAFQAGYVLAWRMIPNLGSGEEDANV